VATRKTALVTGGTGFLGSFLIDFLLRHEYRIVALVRGPAAAGRLTETLQSIRGGANDEAPSRECLSVVEGDVRAPGFGAAAETLRVLSDTVEEIWHCAASFKFQERCQAEVAAHNITGTQNVLDFARECNARRRTPLFHVSTAYAAPLIDGVVREALPPIEALFRNRYEWSKQEAERLVGEYRQHYQIPVFIFRPAIIIGHSVSGRATRFSGYYDVIRAIYQLTRNLEVNLGDGFDRDLRLRVLAGKDGRLNVVPVDFIVEAMWRVAGRGLDSPWIFNLTNDRPPLLEFLFSQACASLLVTGIQLVDSLSFTHRPMSGVERIFNRKTRFQAPYLLDAPAFDNSNFRALVPETILPCPRADEALMRRVNEYYYRDVLDRRFGVPQGLLRSTPRDTVTPGNFSESHIGAVSMDDALGSGAIIPQRSASGSLSPSWERDRERGRPHPSPSPVSSPLRGEEQNGTFPNPELGAPSI
jgi:nucleoside-diphosphate-sugar epimerase